MYEQSGEYCNFDHPPEYAATKSDKGSVSPTSRVRRASKEITRKHLATERAAAEKAASDAKKVMKADKVVAEKAAADKKKAAQAERMAAEKAAAAKKKAAKLEQACADKAAADQRKADQAAAAAAAKKIIQEVSDASPTSKPTEVAGPSGPATPEQNWGLRNGVSAAPCRSGAPHGLCV